MISVEQAQQTIKEHVIDFGVEEISISNSVGRILRHPLITDRDLPPYDRVTMDGIAIRHEEYAAGLRSFQIDGVAAAGSAKLQLTNSSACLEVMTGAIMPGGVDTVIRYEDLLIENQTATIQETAKVNQGQNIHLKGSDREQGTHVVQVGQLIGQPEIGVAASIGASKLQVSRIPKIVVISTGDELVDIHETPLDHQIRKSNVHMIVSMISEWGGEVELLHLPDEYETIKEQLSALFTSADCIILSGGVSKGKFDFLPKALEELGVTKQFHKIKQRPGKPFWFGNLSDQVTVFALPGNPVSSFMCAIRYIQPWIRQCIKCTKPLKLVAKLGADIAFKPDLTFFPIVQTDINKDGILIATPVNNNGSGDFASLCEGNAFLELPAGRDLYSKGEVFDCYTYRLVNR